MSGTILGRNYTTHKSTDLHPPKTFYMETINVQDDKTGETVKKKLKREKKSFYIKPKSKIIVEGINHPKGEPIRFKSEQRAENYIRNFNLGL